MATPIEGLDLNFSKGYDFPSQVTFDKMVRVLKTPKGEKLEGVKSWDKKKIVDNFQLQISSGVETVIHRETGKPVLVQEKATEILERHHDEAGHPGMRATRKVIQDHYHNIPWSLVDGYCKKCQVCPTRNPLPRPPVGQAIQSNEIMGRVQADTMNVRAWADNGINYILQAKDHFSKFVWVFPLPSKECSAVVGCLRGIFYQFGPPKILQTDNGGEFTGASMNELMLEFPSTRHIRSSPRHPQSQGCVERANRTLENRIGAHIQQEGNEGWTKALPRLVFEINRSYTRVTGTTPFEMMFARKPRDPNFVPPTEAVHQDEAGHHDQQSVPSVEPDNAENAAEREEESQPDQPRVELREPHVQFFDPDDPDNTMEPNETGILVYDPNTEIVEEDNRRADIQPPLMELQPLQQPTPYLLFEQSPPEAIAIGLCVPRETVHGSPVQGSELAFEITDILTDNPPLDPPFEVGSYCKWPKSCSTQGLGSTSAHIRDRVPGFLKYLQNRNQQNDDFEKNVATKHKIAVGDVVGMKIPRVDRSSLDPKNMPAKVIGKKQRALTLQTQYGIVQRPVSENHVHMMPSTSSFNFDNASTNPVSLISALRGSTSYNRTANIGCNCKGRCINNACKCRKVRRECGDRCHRGSDCANKEA